mgnify:CR=1 FL=1|tara:strand:- start:1798 stop:3252 length:1455 start_codon:yes stop_codon:yes gene_type:complete
MKQHLTILISLIALLSVNADDILVNESGLQGTYTTISDAVQAANPGDRILIAPQVSPYKEDTLFIDKNLTLMPAATNSFVTFDGHIKLTLDNIDNFTLIGFREAASEGLFKSVFSNINDTTTNTYSIVNIIDCRINTIRLDQPKTSLYLSYSYVEHVAFAHGDIIGNWINNKLYFGLFDYSSIDGSYTNCGYNTNDDDDDDWICVIRDIEAYWHVSHANNLNNSNFMSECELLHASTSIPFGNVNTYSDTCHIIANYFGHYEAITTFNEKFPFNIRNNAFGSSNQNISIYFMCSSDNGTNQIINNGGPSSHNKIQFHLAFCNDNNVDSLFNFSDVDIEILNNNWYNDVNYFWAPTGGMTANSFSTLPINGKGIFAFNQRENFILFGGADSDADLLQVFESWFEIGPVYGSNPSLKYLNLDLTPNTQGETGGSHAWSNYHGDNDYNSAGNMPAGSKARITHLNLPTQILDPSTNINIKAKSVHGN